MTSVEYCDTTFIYHIRNKCLMFHNCFILKFERQTQMRYKLMIIIILKFEIFFFDLVKSVVLSKVLQNKK